MIKPSFWKIFVSGLVISLSGIKCSLVQRPEVSEKEKILHAGPVNSGFGVVYFALYKNNKYKFCDGDFLNDGCYTGYYSLFGDTIVLKDLKKHSTIPTNRFLLRRYKDLDSTYWIWKYPDGNWKQYQYSDFLRSVSGDIFPLDSNNEAVHDLNNYFLIRLDSTVKND